MATMGRRRKSRLDLPPRVYVKHGAYYYVHQSGKWERLAAIGQEAEMRRRWSVLEDPAGQSGTVAALIDEYLVSYSLKHKAARTYKDNCAEAEYLKAFFGQMRPQDILPRHVQQYLNEGLAADRPVRANREKALLSHVFTWAMGDPVWGSMITQNPCSGIHRNTETKRIRMVEDYEYNGVFNIAPRSVQRLMTLVYRTLQRPEDLLKIGPRNIITREIDGIKRRVLKLKQGKTGKEMEIIMTPDIEEAIAQDGKVTWPTFIHATNGKRNGKPYTYTGINSMFRRVLEKYRDEVETKSSVRPAPFGIYDLKGKGATDMYRAGVPLEQIQMLAGHDSVTTTEIYIKARLVDPVMPNERVISV